MKPLYIVTYCITSMPRSYVFIISCFTSSSKLPLFIPRMITLEEITVSR